MSENDSYPTGQPLSEAIRDALAQGYVHGVDANGTRFPLVDHAKKLSAATLAGKVYVSLGHKELVCSQMDAEGWVSHDTPVLRCRK